jgi:hypothetical protein
MTAAVAQPVIEKQAFRNDSPGWIGVTVIGPEGRPKGKGVEPGAIEWLSEQEQILTANAPRNAEDNPFVEQKLYFGVDAEGNPIERVVTPLTPVTENRYVPAGSRPIPAHNMATQPSADEIASEQPPQPEPTPAPSPSTPPAAQTPTPAPPVPPRAAAAVAAASPAVEEETAAATPPPVEHEETGQAVAPSQEATEGEYAAHEEVGTPDAPAAAPTPYTPPEEG